MSAAFDLYFSFRSPYSYLAVERIETLAAAHDLAPNVKVVRPIAVRIPGFFERADPLRGPYVRLDAARSAEMLGLPYRWPRPDPVVMDVATGKVDADQPYIHRLTRLGVAAAEAGAGFAFAREAARTIWSGAVDDWHLGDHLAEAAGRAGLDFALFERGAETEPGRLDEILDANERAQRAAGHWGVPLMVFDGEPFYGQDRVEQMIWRMTQKGAL